MGQDRAIHTISTSQPTIEGAGVHLRRAFGHGQEELMDPFLLLDDFRSDRPQDYKPGFPWHPHRGIETITYVLTGDVEHGDSLGHQGMIGSGDVQWMTAGSGIIHQEMPQGDAQGRMYGFQLWANLPSSHKMMDPRYRDVKATDIPTVTREDGLAVKVIAGSFDGVQGPVRDVVTDPEYLDVALPPSSRFTHPTTLGHTVAAYVIGGKGTFAGAAEPVGDHTLMLFTDGASLTVSTADESVRFLLISGQPIGEPIAWYGPIVMNTHEELAIAYQELDEGTFIKHV